MELQDVKFGIKHCYTERTSGLKCYVVASAIEDGASLVLEMYDTDGGDISGELKRSEACFLEPAEPSAISETVARTDERPYKWTADKPTEEGCYWFCNSSGPLIVYVFDYDGSMRFSPDGLYPGVDVDVVSRETNWSDRPILLPE